MASLLSNNKANLIRLIILLIGIILVMTGGVGLWLELSWGRYLMFAGTGVLLILAASSIVMVYIRRQYLHSHEATLVRDTFWQLRRHPLYIKKHRRFNLPWFYIYSFSEGMEESLRSLGLKPFYPKNPNALNVLQIWLNEYCLVIHIGKPGDDLVALAPLTTITLSHICKMRRQQPLQGIIAQVSPKQLNAGVTLDRELMAHFQQIAQQTHQNLPLVIHLANMDILTSFQGLTGTLHQDETLSPLADWIKTSNQPPLDWLSESWSLLVTKLLKTSGDVMGGNYNTESCSYIVSAVFDITLLGNQLTRFLEPLSEEEIYKACPFSGYFLSADGIQGNNVDPLAYFSQEMCHTAPPPEETNNPEYAFGPNVTREVFGHIGLRATSNQKAEVLLKSFQIGAYIGCLLLFIGTLYWSFLNIKITNRVNHLTTTSINTYIQQELALNPSQRNNLSLLLQRLRPLESMINFNKSISNSYLITQWTTVKNRKKAQSFYLRQLRNHLLPYLIDDQANRLRNDLAGHDIQTIFEALHRYQMLFEPQILTIDDLLPPIINNLAKVNKLSGENHTTLDRMSQTLLKAKEYLTAEPDTELIQAANNQLIGLSDAQLMFIRIKGRQDLSRKLNTTDLLGTNMDHMFASFDTRYAGIPVLYTASSANSNILGEDSKILTAGINDINLFRGYEPQDNQQHIRQISEEMSQRYTREYISYWHDFLNRIHIRPLPDVARQKLVVNTLARWPTSPMAKVLDVITSNTNLQPSNSEASGVAITQMQQQVSREFRRYHQLASGESAAAFTRDMQQLMERLHHCLITYEQAENPSLEAYQQIKQIAEGRHPVNATIAFADHQPKAVQRWIRELNREIIYSLKKSSREHIESLWQKNMVIPFKKDIVETYPFSPKRSDKSRPILNSEHFIAFFQPGGANDAFLRDQFWPLIKGQGQNSLLREMGVRLNPCTEAAIKQFETIQSAFFEPDGKLRSGIQVNLHGLSASATHFLLKDRFHHMVYDHGPELWQDLNWQYLTDNTLHIGFYKNDKLLAHNTLYGHWVWLELFEGATQKPEQTQKDAFITASGHAIKISLRSRNNGDKRPLPDISLLRELQLPDTVYSSHNHNSNTCKPTPASSSI